MVQALVVIVVIRRDGLDKVPDWLLVAFLALRVKVHTVLRFLMAVSVKVLMLLLIFLLVNLWRYYLILKRPTHEIISLALIIVVPNW